EAILRVVRRDVAPVDSQHIRREALDRLDAPGPPPRDPVPHPRPDAHPTDDERLRLPEVARGGGVTDPGQREGVVAAGLWHPPPPGSGRGSRGRASSRPPRRT